MDGRLIFIVGKPRSGTTWLLSILENHTECLPLTPQMLGIEVSRVTKETGLFMRGFSDEEIVARISRLYCAKVLVKRPRHICTRWSACAGSFRTRGSS